MDNFCAHFANLGGPNVLTERSFPLLDFGRDCCKTLETRIWSFGLPIATHNLYSPCCCIGSDAKVEFRALPWRLMQAPQTLWFYFACSGWWVPFLGGRLLSCIFLSNVALFYPLAQIGPMAARKKYWAVALLRPWCLEINTFPTKCAAVRFLWAKCCWRAADFEPVSAHDQVYSCMKCLLMLTPILHSQ